MPQHWPTAERAQPGWAELARRERDLVVRQAAPAAVQTPARRAHQRIARRSYAAAEVNNLTASFSGEHVSINEDLERSLRVMRSRSRQLYKDNDYVKKFMRMVQNHVVGPNGFTLSVPCLRADGSIDEADKAVVEKAFAKWSKRGVCDVTGRLSRTQLERLLALMWARDGEFIVRRVRDRSLNVFGYALQVLDPVLLDESYRADFPDGRRIRLGVETNTWGRPIAYHFRADVESAFGAKRVRVPADEIWHHFIQEEPGQVRGVPWIHSAMRRLNDLGGYIQAAIIAARVGASNAGFFIPPADSTGNAGALASDTTTDGEGNTELVRDATPGTFEELPPGYDFKQFDPDYPHQNFGAFVKAMLQGVSSGMGADYVTLANDLEGVNFSSIRSGKLEVQDEWMCLQGSFKEAFHDPLGPEWLTMGFVSGELAPLPVSKFEKFNVFVWQGRRWPWVDPFKDAQARVLEIDNGLNSYSGVMRELGRDPDTVWRELEKDKQRIGKLLNKPAAPAQPAGAATSKPDKEEPNDE
jgi:lambda family phage portal protein